MNSISATSFLRDKARGYTVELEILRSIQKKYPSARKVHGYFKAFDVEVPETGDSVEVKFDERSDETGNVFIECEFNGEDSGIVTTQASWWAIVDGSSIYWVRPDSLLYIIRQHHCHKVGFTGKDGTTVKSYLLKKSSLEFSPYVKVQKRT